MNKELEALKVRVWNKIKDISNCKFPLDSFFNDIKNYEKEEDKMSLLTDIETIADTFMSIVERKEKLEIIEKHPISYYLLKHNANLELGFTYEDYLRCVIKDIEAMNFNEEALTETEFNLLKEMLEEK